MPDAKHWTGSVGMSVPRPYLYACECWWIYGDVEYLSSNKRDTYARVLDCLPLGHSDAFPLVDDDKPLVYAVGEEKFILIELSPKKDKIPSVYDELYIGEGEGEVIDHVIKRLRYDELTENAKVNLPIVLLEIVNENENRFIPFFNKAAGSCIQLLPNIGEVRARGIVEERRIKPFDSFKDLKRRGGRDPDLRFPDPDVIVAKRIEEEIMGVQDYKKIFVQNRKEIFKKWGKLKMEKRADSQKHNFFPNHDQF